MQPYEVKVAPEDVTETVNRGMAQGWRFLDSRMLPDGKMMLVFDVSQGSSRPVSKPAKKQSTANSCVQLLAALSLAFICLVVVIAAMNPDTEAESNHTPGSVQATIRPNQVVSQPEAYTANNLPVIMKASMQSIDFPTNAIVIYSDTLIVNAPSRSEHYDDVGDYRQAYIGALTGTITSAYEDERTIIDPPSTIQISFTNGSVVAVRVIFSYADALAFRNGAITSNQFINRWQVE